MLETTEKNQMKKHEVIKKLFQFVTETVIMKIGSKMLHPVRVLLSKKLNLQIHNFYLKPTYNTAQAPEKRFH